MLRPFHALCRKSAATLRRHGRSVLLTLCAVAIQTAGANALTATAPVAGLEAAATTGNSAAVLLAAYCDRGRPCPDDEPEARPSRPYKVGPPVEVPCDEAPLPRAYTYRADPPQGYVERRAYEEEDVVRDERSCGIRCWYRRIREGYCGRGCDYYLFRLRHFPSGRFGDHTDRRVACRKAW
jgi:hypothetical protein